MTFNETFTSTPIIETVFQNFPIFPVPFFGYYTINIDTFNLHGKPFAGTGGPGYQYIVDSGTTLNYVPNAFADAWNGAFDPPAVYSETDGVYYVDCKAKNTPLDIVIGGTKFDTNPLDLILLAGTDANGNDVCISGVTQGGVDPASDIYILGDTFQKNVVTVFDIGAGVLRFAAHEHYPSNDPVKV